MAARASAGLAALEAETASALAASASVAGDALVSRSRRRRRRLRGIRRRRPRVRDGGDDQTVERGRVVRRVRARGGMGGGRHRRRRRRRPRRGGAVDPAIRLGDVPGVAIAMDVTSRANDVSAAFAARLAEVSRAADDARDEMVRAASRVPEAVEAAANLARLPAVFDDYDPPASRGRRIRRGGVARGGVGDGRARARLRGDPRGGFREPNRRHRASHRIGTRRRVHLGESRRRRGIRRGIYDAASVAADAAARAADAGMTRLGDAWDGASGGAAWLGVTLPDVDGLTDAASFVRAAADALVGADLAYRFALSARAVARHLAPGAPPLPPIDLTVNLDHRQSPNARAFRTFGGDTGREPPSATARIAGALGHPATLAAIRAVAVALAATLVACAYVPLHEAHAAGCARGCDGTFVTRNAHSLAHNYAAARGSRALAVAATRTETARARRVRRESPPRRRASLAEARANLRAARALAARARRDASRTARCVDVDAYPSGPERDDARDALVAVDDPDDDVWSACAPPNEENPRDETGTKDATRENPGMFIVDDGAAFECGALPACASTCAGPSRRTLAPLARAAGCSAEGLAHDAATRAALTLLVFFFANAARG